MQIHLRGTANCHFQVDCWLKHLQFLIYINIHIPITYTYTNYTYTYTYTNYFILVPAKFCDLRNEKSKNKNKKIIYEMN